MKQRDAISMSREQAEAFLDEGMKKNWTMFLATNGPGGYPHIVSMGWVYRGGRILFQTYAKSQKILNLRRDPKAAVILEALNSGAFDYRKLRGLMIRGICEIDENPERVMEALIAMWENGAAHNRAAGARPQSELLDFVRERAKKRALISFLPQKWASWDHSKLAAGTY